MIRVLHVVVAGDIGGAERLLVDLASRPKESGAEHTVALMTPNPRLADMFAKAGLRLRDRGRVRENPLAYLWRSLGPSDVAWLEGVLRDEQADLAHLHTFGSHVVGARAALRAGVPFIRTEHHVEYFIDPSCSPFTRWSLARAKASVAVSQYVADYIVRIAPAAKDVLCVVRNGVDADHFAPRPRTEAQDAGDRPFKFAVVCRLEPWKGVGLALEALELVPDVHLDIVGEGSEKARLETDATARGLNSRVKFLGYCPDPRDAVADADAILSGSRDEPLGLSVLEALAMARPVVAFASGGIPEIVQDGETGWLVPERNPAALARGMTDAASDRVRARAYGEAGRRFVEKRCRIESMCEGYRDIYESVLKNPARFSPSVEDNGP
ncbi:MAG: glycosyltransferase family 4 protein [Polyangiaceae bacterium]